MLAVSRKNRMWWMTVILWPVIFSAAAGADEIQLINGDKLTGKVVSVIGDTLTLETAYSPQPIKINRTAVKYILTDNPVTLRLGDGEVLKGKITSTVDGEKIVVDGSENREPVVVGWATVEAVNPPPKAPHKWKGNIGIGGTMKSGNTDSKSGSITAEAVRRTEKDRFTMRFQYNYAEEDNVLTARNTYGALKYDYFISKALYTFLSVELLSDEFKDLNLRTVVGPGMGYQIWEDEIKALSIEGGLSYFSEDLDEGEDDQWLTARFSGDLRYKIYDGITFTDYLIVYPNLDSFGEYKLRNEAGLASELVANWALKLSNIFEYDSEAPEDVDSSDLTWILGLQYIF